MTRIAWLPIAALAAVASCSSSPANVEGTYTISLTDEDNGCSLASWTQGNSTTGISVVITQESDSVTAQVSGLAGTYLSSVLGSNTFTGSIDGDNISLTLLGNVKSGNMNSCTYSYQAQLDGSISGDTLTGTIAYTPYMGMTTAGSDCTPSSCTSTQDFNGTRPPT